MIKNVYIVDTESWYWWFDTKGEAEKLIKMLKEEGEEKDIRLTYSKCRVNPADQDDFEELETLEMYVQ